MIKLKKIYMKYICYLLIVALFISTTPTTLVRADAGKDAWLESFKEAVAEESGEQKEYAKEGFSDRMSKNDWYRACIAPWGDHLPWNYFHNKVEKDIRAKDKRFERREFALTKDSGEPGRADICLVMNKIDYLWEVKPTSYKYEPNKTKGLNQLKSYVNGTSDDGFKHDWGPNSGITIPSGHIDTPKYKIDYVDAGNGLIIYEFERKPDDEDPDKNPAIKIDKSKPKKESKDDVSNIVDIGINNKVNDDVEDEDIAAIVISATVCLGIAAGVAAANEKLAKTNTASAAIYQYAVYTCAKMAAFLANPIQVSAAEINNEMDNFTTMTEVFYDADIAEAFRKAIEGGDSDKIEELTKNIQENSKDYEKAGEAQPPRDPLIIDFGIEGIELKSLEHGVNFDLDNNGFAEKTAWIGEEDGFLAYDRNENGIIDNGGELFGDEVIMKDGTKSVSGFEALTELDDNEDGVIDEEDTIFEHLLVWIDRNHNGKSEFDELKSLTGLGILSISLDYKEVSLVDDETGTRIAETADVSISVNGEAKTTSISEFWFPVDSSDTTQGGTVTSGNVPDIIKAIQEDESGILYEYCNEFITINDPAMKRYYLKKILYHITGATNISANSRGGNMDARDLRVIEQFMGRDFVGVGGSSPNTNAAVILKGIYENIENQYYNILNLYGSFGGYYKAIYEYKDESDNKLLDLCFLYYVIDFKIDNRDDVDTLLYDVGVYLRSFDKMNKTTYFDEFKAHYLDISSQYLATIELAKTGITYIGTDSYDFYSGTNNNDFIFGLDGSDSLSGAAGNDVINGNEGDDTISGGDGDDILSGKEGCDTLDGGTGNDILKGGKDNDTYIFGNGYGNDTVIDLNGRNTLRFKGLSVKDIGVNGTGDYNAMIQMKGTKDTLEISDFCKGEEYSNYNLEFEDASMYVTDQISPFRYIYGEEDDDVLKAVVDGSYLYGFEGDDSITGSDGDDVIYGNQGNDRIYGGQGNDRIFGGDGDDILDSKEGNDFLYGGEGIDTYIWGADYGTDIISDRKGNSFIQLTEGISLSDIAINLVGENAVLSFINTEDMLIVNDYLENPENYFIQAGNEVFMLKEHISSEDGGFYSGSENNDYYENDGKKVLAGGKCDDRILGTENGEYVFGDSGNDHLITNNGNDVVFGDTGDDYISGGDGDDYIDAGLGNDIVDGGNGDDIYIFQTEYGKDSIIDSDGSNTIMFSDGLNANGIKAYRMNWDDLLITFDGVEDTLTIKNYCINEAARNFTLVFSDGTIIHATDKNSPLRTIYGTVESEYMESIYTDEVTNNGQPGNDQLVGSNGDDSLYGGDGDDRINGNDGNDILDGGKGNDYLYGNAGNDTYIFKTGYGIDTIGDKEGTNIISIYGYNVDQIKAYRTNWNDITITFGNEDDKIIIEEFFTKEASRNFYLTLNGGSKIHATALGSPLRTIYGTDSNDYIIAMDDNGVTIYGESGDDILNGCGGVDRLYGAIGNDQLYGNDGNDILDGGEGNDSLYGGAGDDVYVFDKGYGKDTIQDEEGINTINFGKEIGENDITVYRTNWTDLTIAVEGMEDILVIANYFTSSNNRNYSLKFANGTEYAYDSMENPLLIAATIE